MKLIFSTYRILKRKNKDGNIKLSYKKLNRIRNWYYVVTLGLDDHNTPYRNIRYMLSNVDDMEVLEYYFINTRWIRAMIKELMDFVHHSIVDIKSDELLIHIFNYIDTHYKELPLMQYIYNIVMSSYPKVSRIRSICYAFPQIINFFGNTMVCTHRRNTEKIKLLLEEFGCNVHAYENLIFKLLYKKNIAPNNLHNYESYAILL